MKARIVAAVALFVILSGSAAKPSEAAPLRQSPAPTQAPHCDVEIDKIASPASIILGEGVQIRLSLKPKCPAEVYRNADIILAIDRSRSMLGSKLAAAKSAARTFVSVTDLSIHQIGVVGFHDTATLDQGLTTDEAALDRAIDGLMIDTGTNMAQAIDVSANELAQHGRANTLGAIILITDGSPNRPLGDPSGAALRSANAAKLQGFQIFAIGLGNDVDERLLKDIVSSPDNYYFAPNESDLEIVYRDIALVVGNFALRDLVVDDELPPTVTLSPTTAVPDPVVVGRKLRWTNSLVPETGLQWTYTITPTVAGTYATNVQATASYKTSDGIARQATFPVPTIEVVAPEPEPVCSVINSWTVTVHSFPDAVGVSSIDRPGCNNRFDSGDWAGGTGHKLPPLEYQLTDASGAVLFQGTGVPSAGRVDQWLYIRVCEPPPYTLKLLSTDLGGYEACFNSPQERQITKRNFRPEVFHRTEERFGFVR